MIQLPSGAILSGLGLGFAPFDVGDGGSTLWYGVAGRSLNVRSVVPLVRGSTTGVPLPCYVAKALTSSATMKGMTESPSMSPRGGGGMNRQF
jgi:hypothetical protein